MQLLQEPLIEDIKKSPSEIEFPITIPDTEMDQRSYGPTNADFCQPLITPKSAQDSSPENVPEQSYQNNLTHGTFYCQQDEKPLREVVKNALRNRLCSQMQAQTPTTPGRTGDNGSQCATQIKDTPDEINNLFDEIPNLGPFKQLTSTSMDNTKRKRKTQNDGKPKKQRKPRITVASQLRAHRMQQQAVLLNASQMCTESQRVALKLMQSMPTPQSQQIYWPAEKSFTDSIKEKSIDETSQATDWVQNFIDTMDSSTSGISDTGHAETTDKQEELVLAHILKDMCGLSELPQLDCSPPIQPTTQSSSGQTNAFHHSQTNSATEPQHTGFCHTMEKDQVISKPQTDTGFSLHQMYLEDGLFMN